jgi:hypothetical protein
VLPKKLKNIKEFNINPFLINYLANFAFGNTSKYSFVVRGRKQPIEPFDYREKYFFTWDKTNYLQEPGLSLVVPKGMLYKNTPLNYQVKADSGAVAFTYQINDKSIPSLDLDSSPCFSDLIISFLSSSILLIIDFQLI